MDTQKKIGLFGFGVVGEGVYRVLHHTPALQLQVKKIAIRHAEKIRKAPAYLFTTDADEILLDKEIGTIVELIDDAEAAYVLIKRALLLGKNVVSANKKMLAEHLKELIEIQKQQGVSLLYEAAVAGSIPILRNLEEYYNNDLLQSIQGIVNGSTNYILTQMAQRGWSYEAALKQAQELGFAERDPSLDVEGVDAANKLVLLLKHTFGVEVYAGQLLTRGITCLSEQDFLYAREKELSVKLVASACLNEAGEVSARVLPRFIQKTNPLYSVLDEYNGIRIGSLLSDQQFLYGKGAGRYPTSSAVLSDLAALNYGYRYEYKRAAGRLPSLSGECLLHVYVSFAKAGSIPSAHFEEVEEQYSSGKKNYIIGRLRSKALQFPMFNTRDVSVIEMPEALEAPYEFAPSPEEEVFA